MGTYNSIIEFTYDKTLLLTFHVNIARFTGFVKSVDFGKGLKIMATLL